MGEKKQEVKQKQQKDLEELVQMNKELQERARKKEEKPD